MGPPVCLTRSAICDGSSLRPSERTRSSASGPFSCKHGSPLAFYHVDGMNHHGLLRPSSPPLHGCLPRAGPHTRETRTPVAAPCNPLCVSVSSWPVPIASLNTETDASAWIERGSPAFRSQYLLDSCVEHIAGNAAERSAYEPSSKTAMERFPPRIMAG